MDFALGSEMNSDEFSESGRVVVLDSLGVSESLKDRITSDKLFIQIATIGTFTLDPAN